MTVQQDNRLEIAMGYMLRIGVTLAAGVVAVGCILYLREFGHSTPDYHQFHDGQGAITSLQGVLNGLSHFDSKSVIAFGLLLLIATPTCRVIFAVVGFSLERDKAYAIISAIVLAILMVSLFTGR
jgi:uncharacterized membrane protein